MYSAEEVKREGEGNSQEEEKRETTSLGVRQLLAVRTTYKLFISFLVASESHFDSGLITGSFSVPVFKKPMSIMVHEFHLLLLNCVLFRRFSFILEFMFHIIFFWLCEDC